MKLFSGTDGSSTPVAADADRGLKVNAAQIARISVTPTISAASIYAAGDAVGGLLTFANAARFSGGGVIVSQAVIIDLDKEVSAMDLVLFDRTFTNSADNAVFDPTDADLANLVAVIPVTTYASFNDNAVGYSQIVDIPVKPNGTSLFGQLVTRTTPTYTATSDITVILSVIQE
jgi:hypothetical protein